VLIVVVSGMLVKSVYDIVHCDNGWDKESGKRLVEERACSV
jgi:hypothetical protein